MRARAAGKGRLRRRGREGGEGAAFGGGGGAPSLPAAAGLPHPAVAGPPLPAAAGPPYIYKFSTTKIFASKQKQPTYTLVAMITCFCIERLTIYKQ